MTWRQLLLSLALVIASATVLLAQAVTIGPTDAIGFDYLDADFTTSQVSRFEAQYDGGAWVSLGIPSAFVDGLTMAGAKTYKVIPSFTTGNHTVLFRACNVAGCGGASSPFAFTAVSAPNGVPSNIRKIAR